MNSNKSIDINQRIPLHVLHTGLERYLKDDYSGDYILEQLRLDYEGENRLKKALRIVNKTIPKNPIIKIVIENKESVLQALKRKGDRELILIALLNSAFPFSYEVLRLFGKYFAVQDLINADSIKKALFNSYGGNRATENGMYSVIPMFLEANLFTRPRNGVYSCVEQRQEYSPISKLIYKESFKINNALLGLDDLQLLDPYFEFFR